MFYCSSMLVVTGTFKKYPKMSENFGKLSMLNTNLLSTAVVQRVDKICGRAFLGVMH